MSRRAISTEELAEEVEWFLSFGEWPERIASRLGLKVESLERALHRAGRTDLVAKVHVHKVAA